MPPKTDNDIAHQSVLPKLPLLLLLAGTLGFAWLLKPSETEMLERMLKDQHLGQIITCLQERGRLDRGKTLELRHLSGKRLAAVAQLFKLTPREQLHSIFRPGRTFEYDLPAHGLVLRAVEFVDVIPPHEALEIIRPRLDEVPPELRLDILELVGKNAHAVGMPSLAVECYKLASQMPESRWTTLQTMAQTFRWEGRSREASEILRKWLAKHSTRLSERERTQAEELQYVLSLEAGQPSEAFDHILAQLKALPPNTAPSADLIVQATQAAMYAGRGGEVVPWVEAFVKTLPDCDTPWKQLHTLAAADPSRFVELKRWWSTLGRLCDWNRRADLAFNYHLRSAALGDLDCLDRCLSLHAVLGRTEDCAELLQALGPLPDRENSQALLATMLGNLGRENEACDLFLQWLANHPEDRDTRYNLACLYEDIGEQEASIGQLEKLVELRPNDSQALTRLATAKMRQKKFADVLAILRKMPAKAHNEETLEGLANIAESLDQHEDRIRALQMMLAHKGKPEPRDFLDLADAAGYTDKPERAVEFLTQGIKQFPKVPAIRIALANLHAEKQDYAAALQTAMQPETRGLFEIAAFLLPLAPHVPNAQEVLDFLGPDLETKHVLSSEDRLDLAVLHHKAGHEAEAKRLFATVPETLENLRAIGSARYHCQDYQAAERVMLDLMGKTHDSSASDWVFLGDIYQLMNRPEEAQRAYDHSLALLSSDLPHTVAR